MTKAALSDFPLPVTLSILILSHVGHTPQRATASQNPPIGPAVDFMADSKEEPDPANVATQLLSYRVIDRMYRLL